LRRGKKKRWSVKYSKEEGIDRRAILKPLWVRYEYLKPRARFSLKENF
jgi:hypothetical protein